MDKQARLKFFFILFYTIVSLIGLLDLSVNLSVSIYVFNVNLRPVVYAYTLFVVSALSAIQLAWLLEALIDGKSPEFLLTTFFRMTDEPQHDVVKDPIAFLGLLLLLLGGYVLWPLAFFIGILRAILMRPPSTLWLEALIKALLSYVIIIPVLLAIGIAFIEKRYA